MYLQELFDAIRERTRIMTEENHALPPPEMNLRCRDIAEFGSNVGFWMAADAPDWATATQQQRDDSGFWCDANGYCLTADPTSKNKSLWW